MSQTITGEESTGVYVTVVTAFKADSHSQKKKRQLQLYYSETC